MSAYATPFVIPTRIEPAARTPSARRSMKARIVSPLRRIGVRSVMSARATEAPGGQRRTRVREEGNWWTKFSESTTRGDSESSRQRRALECTARGALCTAAAADYWEIRRSRRTSGALSVAFQDIARDQLGITIGRRPVAAPTWKLNLHECARRHELLGLRIRRRHAVNQDSTAGPRPAAEEAARRIHRTIAEDRRQERLPRAYAKGDGLAEAAAVFAEAA